MEIFLAASTHLVSQLMWLVVDSRVNGTQITHIIAGGESGTHCHKNPEGKDQNINPSVVMCPAHTNMICDHFCETCAVDICIICTIIGDYVEKIPPTYPLTQKRQNQAAGDYDK